MSSSMKSGRKRPPSVKSAEASEPEPQPSSSNSTNSVTLTAEQKARIESNRQKALLLKNSLKKSPQPAKKRFGLHLCHTYGRVLVYPLMERASVLERYTDQSNEKAIIRVEGVKFIDTGGGFLLEQKDGEEEQQRKFVEDPAPILEPDWPTCEECSTKFMQSFLLTHFDHLVCDKCRDNEGIHSLITKSDARNEYLLKDCDLEKREPPLQFLTRKNPHDSRWGDMKLYLQLQVERRALEVWGSEEQLEEERERRDIKKEKTKEKKYNKKMKELRMAVRSSLYNRIREAHVHEFGPETHVEEDTYTRKCTSCEYEESFEKM